jgi:hypothetical protein
MLYLPHQLLILRLLLGLSSLRFKSLPLVMLLSLPLTPLLSLSLMLLLSLPLTLLLSPH